MPAPPRTRQVFSGSVCVSEQLLGLDPTLRLVSEQLLGLDPTVGLVLRPCLAALKPQPQDEATTNAWGGGGLVAHPVPAQRGGLAGEAHQPHPGL